jgi:hypothetical protein
MILDVSNLVLVKVEKSQQLFNGKLDLTNGKESSRTYFPLSLTFNLATLKGTVRGIGIEDRRTTAPDRDGVQVTRGTTDCDVSGKGVVNGSPSYFEGKVNLKGRSASIR